MAAIQIIVDSSKLRIPQVKEAFKQKLKEELKTIGLEIETNAKMELTVKNHIVTGRLRASVHSEMKHEKIDYSGMTGVEAVRVKREETKRRRALTKYKDIAGKKYNGKLSESPRELEVIIGTNVVYAMKIERLDAYLFPSFERAKPVLLQRIRNIVNSL